MILASFFFSLLQSSDVASWANMQFPPQGHPEMLGSPSRKELVSMLLNNQQSNTRWEFFDDSQFSGMDDLEKKFF